MSPRRIPRRRGGALLLLLGVAVAIGAGGAGALPAVSRHVTVLTAGSGTVVINQSFTQTLHYTPANVTVRSGGTLTFEHGSGDKFGDLHTLTIARKSELPHTALQVDTCNACGLAAGNFPSPTNPTGKPFVDVGKPGLDERGDSIGIAPTKGAKFTVTVTAKPGQTLYFFCAVHPWMQGVIHVK